MLPFRFKWFRPCKRQGKRNQKSTRLTALTGIVTFSFRRKAFNHIKSGKHYELEADPKIPNGKAYMIFTYTGNMIDEGYIGKKSEAAGRISRNPEYLDELNAVNFMFV